MNYKRITFNIIGSILLTILVVMLTWIIYLAIKTGSPKENLQITYSHILECPTSRHADQIGFRYGFEKDGHTIVAGTFDYAGQLTMSDCKQYFIGRSFPVIYDSLHPDKNSILIDSIAFRNYNIPFPDSQQWIYQYLRGQDDPRT